MNFTFVVCFTVRVELRWKFIVPSPLCLSHRLQVCPLSQAPSYLRLLLVCMYSSEAGEAISGIKLDNEDVVNLYIREVITAILERCIHTFILMWGDGREGRVIITVCLNHDGYAVVSIAWHQISPD